VRRTEVKPKESRAWHGARIARPARIALDLLLRLSPCKLGWGRRLRVGVPDLDAYLGPARYEDPPWERTFGDAEIVGSTSPDSLCNSPIFEPNHYLSRNCV
jgi:hypothetical protein